MFECSKGIISCVIMQHSMRTLPIIQSNQFTKFSEVQLRFLAYRM
jgi:hypothetical protein